MAEVSSPFPPPAGYLHPDGWLGMASDQGCAPSLCLALLQSILAGTVWHDAMMCANTQTAGRVTHCNQVFSSLLSFAVSFTWYVSLISCGHHQFGSLDNELQGLAPPECTWCWEGLEGMGLVAFWKWTSPSWACIPSPGYWIRYWTFRQLKLRLILHQLLWCISGV